MASLAIVAVLKDADGSVLAGYGIVVREFTNPAPLILDTPPEDDATG